MEGGDRGLRLELAEAVAGEGGLEDLDGLGDDRGVPEGAVLVGEGDERAVGRGAGRAAGVVEEHQREQAVDLGVVGERRDLAGEADRLGGEVDVAGVALVEDQVERAEDGRQVAGGVEADVGDGALRAGDALGHGRLGDEVGRGDLLGGEAADRPERQGDRRGRRQARVGAEEVELEGVVGVLGRAWLRLELGLLLACRPGRLGAGGVEELAPGGGDEPGLRVPWRVVRPGGPGCDEGLLDGVLGRREVCSAPDEDADHLGGEASQELLVHLQFQPFLARFRHASLRPRGSTTDGQPWKSVLGMSVMNGRTSSHSWIGSPLGPGAADSWPASS